MSGSQRPRLGKWPGRHTSQSGEHIIIFVHGILSDSSTFENLIQNIAEIDGNFNFDFWIFDYDYNQTLSDSADQLAAAIKHRAFGGRRVDIVGHSMGGLVARLALLRNMLPGEMRIVTLATPNHGTIRGAQLNLLSQLTTLALRRIRPLYARAPGILDLTNVHSYMKEQLNDMSHTDIHRIEGKTYVSIPAQYFHTMRQLGEKLPSAKMGGVDILTRVSGKLTPLHVALTPVHDGIVEERSNQLEPHPVGSSNEGAFMPKREDINHRILHATHQDAADHDHITITSCWGIADLIQAILRAPTLSSLDIDPLLRDSPGKVKFKPKVE